ncbi:MAG: TIGR00282 family metallophosphoesterase [Candidatus Omnitrophica bacterium]|nr:TIGR00282 family metallophosphoesterase [Candidatus Omnitrophota bacterium]
MRILAIGDVVGRPGRVIVERYLAQLRGELDIDVAIVNCENAAGGAGVTPAVAEELFRAGADVLTSGNHVWKKKEVIELLKLDHRVLRPANYADGAPGAGSVIVESLSGQKVGVLNLQGRVFMPDLVDCPFRTALKELDRLRLVTSVIVVDMHAEATSEKVAIGWFLDGKVSCVFGTHTHIATADERLLPKGTAFITDVGMTGPYDSVIGRKTDQILERFLLGIPVRSEVAETNVQLHGIVIDVDPKTGKASSIARVTRTLEERVAGAEK